MHECFAGLPFSPRAAALISPRTTFPCHPHDTPVDLLASSRTAGSGSRELEFPTDPSRLSRTVPPAPPLLFRNSYLQAAGPSQPRPSRAIPSLPLSSTSALPGTAPPDRHTCSKKLVYMTSDSLPQHGPSLALGSNPFRCPLRRRERLLQTVLPVQKNQCTTPLAPSSKDGHSWPKDQAYDASPRHRGTAPPGPPRHSQKALAATETSPMSTRLTSDHSGRLPGREADSSDPECSARATNAKDGPGSPS
jgi:hypothetical protein